MFIVYLFLLKIACFSIRMLIFVFLTFNWYLFQHTVGNSGLSSLSARHPG